MMARFGKFLPMRDQFHEVWAVADHNTKWLNIETGVGVGVSQRRRQTDSQTHAFPRLNYSPAGNGVVLLGHQCRSPFRSPKGGAMAVERLIEYEQAEAEVRAVYDDIRATRKTDFINNFWKVLANDPSDAEAHLGIR